MEGSEPDTTERAAIESERGWFERERKAAASEAGGEPSGDGPGAFEDERAAAEPEGTERDTTDEWRIAPERTPGTVAELEERIDAALVTAQAAEEAALEIGAASVEAADQARRAAAMAEQASAAASRAASDAAIAAESSAASRAVIDAAPWRTAVAAAPAPAAPGATAPVDPDRGAPSPSAAPASAGRPSRTDFTPRPNGVDPRRPDPFEERITAFRLRAEKVMIRLQKLEAGFKPGDGPSEVVRLR